MAIADIALKKAASFNGQRNSFVDIYNSHTPLARRYRVKYEDELCATYVSAIFIDLGWYDIVPPECGAFRLYRNMKAIGRDYWGNDRVPNRGDLIFFGPGPNYADWRISHVGIVDHVEGDNIIFWDIAGYVVSKASCKLGNKYTRKYGYVTAYGMPDYESKSSSEMPDIPSAPEIPEPKNREFKAGDLVKIKPGAKWYRGQTIKPSVFDTSWYIIQVNGDRAVLGMDVSERSNIQSPINVMYLDHVFPVPIEPTPEPKEPVKIAINAFVLQETADRLGSISEQTGKDIGAIIDSIVKELK